MEKIKPVRSVYSLDLIVEVRKYNLIYGSADGINWESVFLHEYLLG